MTLDSMIVRPVSRPQLQEFVKCQPPAKQRPDLSVTNSSSAPTSIKKRSGAFFVGGAPISRSCVAWFTKFFRIGRSAQALVCCNAALPLHERQSFENGVGNTAATWLGNTILQVVQHHANMFRPRASTESQGKDSQLSPLSHSLAFGGRAHAPK